jgi:penicillin-binding protein 1B
LAVAKAKDSKKRKGSRAGKPVPAVVPWRGWMLRNGIFLLVIVAALYTLYLDTRIRAEFEGKRWALPARVYARPLELYPGLLLSPEQFAQELALLNYQVLPTASRPGSYQRSDQDFLVASRPFKFWDAAEPGQRFRLRFSGGRVAALVNADSGVALPLLRLDPYEIGSLLPAQNEDRILVRRADIPPLLLQTLVAVEDRRFYEHSGVDAVGLLRAAWTNLRQWEIVQGGSTITQQLVKNFFLTQARTWTRKLNEMIMALLLEWHYSKDEILEAYCNEVFLGQDGRRAIHGFGLASRFYFGQDLAQLSAAEAALLVGMVKGPSFYEPRRHPQRALERRNQVLNLAAAAGVLTPAQAQEQRQTPLRVAPVPLGLSRFPAYLDLVRRQLRRDYRDEDLRSEGLLIFTTLDPLVQLASETAASQGLRELDKLRTAQGELEVAALVTNVANGEVLAAVGGRDPKASGFNRALLAERQVGSLIKPAVYLAALEQGYTLASPLQDVAVTLRDAGSEEWSPQNYDEQFHGTVPLYLALAQSYNAATVRLGMDVGIPPILDVIQRLGITRELPSYPSLMLGAAVMTPLEVAQMYQTLAAGGFVTPLRAIRSIVSAEGNPLQRYAVDVREAVASQPVYLLNNALQQVVQQGTARTLGQRLGRDLGIAGKTGTTNDLRDSWFAGFSGDRLAVVWIGRDDNGTTGLTGASGAMRVFAQIMKQVSAQALRLAPPDGVEWVWVDAQGLRSAEGCAEAVPLPFVTGSAPQQRGACGAPPATPLENTLDWFKGLMQ